MKITFYDCEGWEGEMIKSRFPEHEIILKKEALNDESVPVDDPSDIISVFVSSKVTEKVLNGFPNLKLVVARSTGYDHIDREACAKRGIVVSYVPGYGDNTVAEFAFGLILMLARKLYPAVDRIKETSSFSQEGLRGFDLKGKTIGIIGTGRIGKEAVRIAKGFGMKVVAFDPYPDAAFAAAAEISYLSLDELLGSADVVSIHCPLIPETKHLINSSNIGKFKRGAYLVNTARGGIVETQALAEALRSGILAGAALDVLEEEGEIKDELGFLAHGHPSAEELKVLLGEHVLMHMPNVLITPHNAFNSQEALERILNTSFENIEKFMAGAAVNVVE